MNAFAKVADIYGSSSSSTLDQDLIGPTTAANVSILNQNQPPLQQTQVLPALRGMNPIVGGVVILGVLFALKFLREWGSPEGDVKKVEVDLYFVGMVTLAAAAGLPILKAILAKYHLGAISDYVQNA